MENRIAMIGIFVYDRAASERINALLHEANDYIVGRMGIPYREKQISVISVILDAPNDVIGALSGKLGMVENVQVKTLYAKAMED